MTVRKFAALLSLVFAFSLVPSSAAVADDFGLRVYGDVGAGEQELAVFKTAKCIKGKQLKGGSYFFADGTSTNGAYKFSVSFFRSFTGFHNYRLVLAENADIVLSFYPVGAPNADFSNEYVPPFPAPGEGQVRFTKNGKHMRVGFIPVLWNRAANAQIIIAGGVDCRYRRK